MQIGGFVSAAGGIYKVIERAEEEGFAVPMCFIGSPQSWNLPVLSDEDVLTYNELLEKSTIVQKTYAHALYLANLASPDKSTVEKSIKALSTTMQNGEKINLAGVIFHLGSHKDSSHEEGLQRVAEGMQQVLKNSPGNTHLIMENSVQQGNKVGTSLQDLAWVLEAVDHDPRISVCLDTCHSFAMGYNFADATSYQQWIDDIQSTIGLESLECFHINDSQGELDSHIDRHANIGEGNIGLEGFKRIVNEPLFEGKSFILEVPGLNEKGPSALDKEVLQSLQS